MCAIYSHIRTQEYILGLVWQQRKHLALACGMLLLCTASNLAAPVLSGMLMELLVQQKPIEEYAKVGEAVCSCRASTMALTR